MYAKSFFYDRTSYVKECNVSFYDRKINGLDVVKVIDAMDCNKAPGIDGIRVRDLKLVKEHISPVLAMLIINCISNGIYPDLLKTAIIRPIFKRGSHRDYTNYRPMAILSTINKIFEKVVMKQIGEFLDKHSVLTSSQHGFRSNKNTATALSEFSDDVNNAFNNRDMVVVLYIDFKKAFDTLEHECLLQAMEECGIRGPVNAWFRNYLENRKIVVRINGVDSNTGKIKYGVPTGSVFGPIGYTMHVNSLVNVVRNCRIYMYADDICLDYSGRDGGQLQMKIQQDFNNVIKWSHDNGIIINLHIINIK
ncbi:unnamed protein product [Euphydryas editha]|uniref:Reverse transcriptase domain-containing protein n=1 Tax=Euphydryas editha TaxID=104508 RepID=A0AAU9U2V3_EUPED|nr:unnamed protein product [Euphydryas editha]